METSISNATRARGQHLFNQKLDQFMHMIRRNWAWDMANWTRTALTDEAVYLSLCQRMGVCAPGKDQYQPFFGPEYVKPPPERRRVPSRASLMLPTSRSSMPPSRLPQTPQDGDEDLDEISDKDEGGFVLQDDSTPRDETQQDRVWEAVEGGDREEEEDEYEQDQQDPYDYDKDAEDPNDVENIPDIPRRLLIESGFGDWLERSATEGGDDHLLDRIPDEETAVSVDGSGASWDLRLQLEFEAAGYEEYGQLEAHLPGAG